jgi:hypothetical protein
MNLPSRGIFRVVEHEDGRETSVRPCEVRCRLKLSFPINREGGIDVVLRLRLRPKPEQVVKATVEGGVEGLERDLNSQTNWIFEQSERRWLNGRCVELSPLPILLSGRYKLVLLPQSDKSCNFHYDILAILMANKTDRIDALNGQQVDDSIQVLPSSVPVWPRPRDRATAPNPASNINQTPSIKSTTVKTPTAETDSQRFIITPTCPACRNLLVPCRGIYCQHCNLKLPPEIAVHPEIIIAVKKKDYDELATHLKQRLNVAWTQLLKGRKIDKTVGSMGERIFLVTVKDDNCCSTLVEEQRLDDALVDTRIGRVSSDRYEVEQVRKMAARTPP